MTNKLTRSEYLVWKKEKVTEMLLIALDDLAKAEMMAWSGGQFDNEDADKQTFQHARCRGRIDAYRNLGTLLQKGGLFAMAEDEV